MVRISILIKAFRHLCSFCDVYNKNFIKLEEIDIEFQFFSFLILEAFSLFSSNQHEKTPDFSREVGC